MAQKRLLFLQITIIFLISKTNGLSMEMIPINSPHLQIVPQSFTKHETTNFLINISLSRPYNIQRKNPKSGPNSFDVPVYGVLSDLYVTSLTIGSGSGSLAPVLVLDTGADVTWVQCQGCFPCIELSEKNFAYRESRTFSRMSVTDKLCDTDLTYEGSCRFYARFSAAVTIGFVGRDNFYLKNTRTGQIDAYPRIAFGCGLENSNFDFGMSMGTHNVIAGILGLAPGRQSFLTQLDNQIKGRFSYCLSTWKDKSPRMSTMYFGDDAQISGDDTRQVQVISTHTVRYHLYLNGISVDGVRLPIDPSVFDFDPIEFTKGFIIDTGAPYTILAKSAHDPLLDAIAKYFDNKHGMKPLRPHSPTEFQLCYGSYREDISFPSVILHFRLLGHAGEVDMVLGKDNMLNHEDGDDVFCLMVLPTNDPGPCLFGAFQQANFKFLHDVSNSLLYFVPERCLENSG